MGVALFGANKSQAPSSLSNEASLHHRVGALVGRACGEGDDLRRHELFVVHETLRNDAVLAWVLFGQLRDSLDSVHAVDDAKIRKENDELKMDGTSWCAPCLHGTSADVVALDHLRVLCLFGQ